MKPTQAVKVLSDRTNQIGFAMIEVLASLLVLTVGLLSVAGLSANALKASDTSSYRARAAREVIAISDAIRSNRQAASDDEFNVGLGPTEVPSTTKTTIVNSVAEWKSALRQIPNGQGSILYVEARDTVVISVQWDEGRTGGRPDEKYVLELRL
jgi:type IV pilus assembly protein PilV